MFPSSLVSLIRNNEEHAILGSSGPCRAYEYMITQKQERCCSKIATNLYQVKIGCMKPNKCGLVLVLLGPHQHALARVFSSIWDSNREPLLKKVNALALCLCVSENILSMYRVIPHNLLDVSGQFSRPLSTRLGYHLDRESNAKPSVSEQLITVAWL